MACFTANADDEEEYDVEKNDDKFKWWRHIGSTSQFGDGGIHFSCWDWSQ